MEYEYNNNHYEDLSQQITNTSSGPNTLQTRSHVAAGGEHSATGEYGTTEECDFTDEEFGDTIEYRDAEEYGYPFECVSTDEEYGATDEEYGATDEEYGATGGEYSATGGGYGATEGGYEAAGGECRAAGGECGGIDGPYDVVGRQGVAGTNSNVGTSGPKDDECSICMDKFNMPVTLPCSHKFCKRCMDQLKYISKSNLCPVCRVPFSIAEGKQPRGGQMSEQRLKTSLPGHANCGTIMIHYSMPSGTQGPEHPHPGKRYHGASRTAFLPDNTKGDLVHRLLRKAFDQRLIFTVDRSITSGRDNCVVWNDIHHKTSQTGGSSSYGYPDADYLDRVIDDLKAKGITE